MFLLDTRPNTARHRKRRMTEHRFHSRQLRGHCTPDSLRGREDIGVCPCRSAGDRTDGMCPRIGRIQECILWVGEIAVIPTETGEWSSFLPRWLAHPRIILAHLTYVYICPISTQPGHIHAPKALPLDWRSRMVAHLDDVGFTSWNVLPLGGTKDCGAGAEQWWLGCWRYCFKNPESLTDFSSCIEKSQALFNTKSRLGALALINFSFTDRVGHWNTHVLSVWRMHSGFVFVLLFWKNTLDYAKRILWIG